MMKTSNDWGILFYHRSPAHWQDDPPTIFWHLAMKSAVGCYDLVLIGLCATEYSSNVVYDFWIQIIWLTFPLKCLSLGDCNSSHSLSYWQIHYHYLCCVFTYIYSLLIEKDICDCQNVSVKLLCVFMCAVHLEISSFCQ